MPPRSAAPTPRRRTVKSGKQEAKPDDESSGGDFADAAQPAKTKSKSRKGGDVCRCDNCNESSDKKEWALMVAVQTSSGQSNIANRKQVFGLLFSLARTFLDDALGWIR